MCLTGVCDGGRAHFKVALGRCQLFSHGRLLRAHKCQCILRCQHIKIALTGTHDQILLCHIKLCLGHIDLTQPLLVGGQVGGTVKRLRGGQCCVLRAEAAVGHRVVVLKPGTRHASSQTSSWQNACPCLLRPRQVGIVLQFGRLVSGIKSTCRVIQLGQVLRLRAHGQQG